MSEGPLIEIINCMWKTAFEKIDDLIVAQIYNSGEKGAYCLNWDLLTFTVQLNKFDNFLLVAK